MLIQIQANFLASIRLNPCSVDKGNFMSETSKVTTSHYCLIGDATGSEILCLPCGRSRSNKKNIHKATYNYYRKGIVKYKLKIRIHAKVACNQIK